MVRVRLERKTALWLGHSGDQCSAFALPVLCMHACTAAGPLLLCGGGDWEWAQAVTLTTPCDCFLSRYGEIPHPNEHTVWVPKSWNTLSELSKRQQLWIWGLAASKLRRVWFNFFSWLRYKSSTQSHCRLLGSHLVHFFVLTLIALASGPSCIPPGP